MFFLQETERLIGVVGVEITVSDAHTTDAVNTTVTILERFISDIKLVKCMRK